MRNTNYRSNRPQTPLPWKWIIILISLIGIIFLARIFKGTSINEGTHEYLSINNFDKSIAYIGTSEGSKTRIKNGDKLYALNMSIQIDNQEGFHVQGKNQYIFTDIDKSSELTYKSQSVSGGILNLNKGRAWIQVEKSPLEIQLKIFSVHATPENIFLVEQNTMYSTAYALKGDLNILTPGGNFTLTAGNRIMLRESDIDNGKDISQFAGEIDDSILQNTLFIANGGDALLKEVTAKNKENSTSGSIVNLGILGSGSTMSSNAEKYIKINQPVDGSAIESSKITVMGDILSKDIKRITINDRDASVSPVNESFVLQDVDVDGEIFNIVYKAYNSENQILDKGVITIYGKNAGATSQKLIPENFPLSNKDFQIFFPKENPYKTNDSLVKVQGIVPKNTVQYIMVNDYRLQKFVPNSSMWYYFANTETETMKEGINIYNIKFYNSDNKLLYTQLFTIVKETKNATISSEIIQ